MPTGLAESRTIEVSTTSRRGGHASGAVRILGAAAGPPDEASRIPPAGSAAEVRVGRPEVRGSKGTWERFCRRARKGRSVTPWANAGVGSPGSLIVSGICRPARGYGSDDAPLTTTGLTE